MSRSHAYVIPLLLLIALLFVSDSGWAAGFDKPPVVEPAMGNSPRMPAARLRGPRLRAPSFFGQPADVTADAVLGQPDMVSNADTGPTRTSIGYPMGSAYLARGDSHYLFVCDQGYSRILIYDSAADIQNGQPAMLVIGQNVFFTGSANRMNPIPDSASLAYPGDICVDADGNLYAADYLNHRVLIYRDPIGTDLAADSVIGQGGAMNTRTVNKGGISASSLNGPLSVAVDADRNLYVADANNHRILIYFDPLNTDAVADRVLGQSGSFTTNAANAEGISASTLNQPYRVRLDPSSNLYATDLANSRGLIFNTPIEEDDVADVVIGQPDFSTGTANSTGRSASSINQPCSLGVDAYANLYMADWGNNRVLFFKRPLAEDTVADVVFGQNDFASADNFSPSSTSLSGAQRIDFDPDGNLYISDCYNSRLLKFKIAAVANKCPVPWITAPATGSSVSGNAVGVIAHLAGSGAGITMQFQYRKETSTTSTEWAVLGPDVQSRPYMLKWNTTVAGWSDGDTVWLRAAAFTTDDTTYSLPVRVKIKRHGADVEESEGEDGEDREKKEKVDKGRKESVRLAASVTVEIPPSALDSDATLTVASLADNPVSDVPDDMAHARGVSYQRFEFDNGQEQFHDTLSLQFEYADADNNGIIDGTDVAETTAWVYWAGAADTGWDRLDTVLVNCDSNTVTARVTHFSIYAVFGAGPAPLAVAAVTSAGVGSSVSGSSPKTMCLIGRSGMNRILIQPARVLRDRLVESAVGRRMVGLYYRIFG